MDEVSVCCRLSYHVFLFFIAGYNHCWLASLHGVGTREITQTKVELKVFTVYDVIYVLLFCITQLMLLKELYHSSLQSSGMMSDIKDVSCTVKFVARIVV